MLSLYKMEITNQQKYFALVGFVLSQYKKTLRIINRSIENNNLRLIIENTMSDNIAFIYIRNINFYRTAELLEILEQKIQNLF